MNIDDIIMVMKNDLTIKVATYYISPKEVIRVTRQHKHIKRQTRSYTFVVSTGVPNYLARVFIKLCRKAGEPFPVKKLQMSYYPVKKKSIKRSAVKKVVKK